MLSLARWMHAQRRCGSVVSHRMSKQTHGAGLVMLELHDHLIRSGRAVPTILITAFPKDADRALAMRTGVCCYLSKPFSETDLLSCIRSTIASPGAGAPA